MTEPSSGGREFVLCEARRTVVCTNPGTPYSSNYDPHAPSPTCGYTYQTPSSTSGNGAFQLTATTTWRVT
ncbi:MAG: hypothetical protein ACYDAQ_14925 [Mycobacteriales bacterium]